MKLNIYVGYLGYFINGLHDITLITRHHQFDCIGIGVIKDNKTLSIVPDYNQFEAGICNLCYVVFWLLYQPIKMNCQLTVKCDTDE